CVGRLCLPIFGDQSPAAERYAHHLGLALQFTNILRDVGEDALRDRVYLPQDLLDRHGLSASDILAARYDDRFIAAAEVFAAIAEAEYRAAAEAFAECSDRRVLLPAEVMGKTYYAILQGIRDRRFDVFARRANLRRRDKLRVAMVALARTKLPDAVTTGMRSRSGAAEPR